MSKKGNPDLAHISVTDLLSPSKRFLEPDYTSVPYEQARVVVMPVPYERTASYGRGTRFGPDAILDASTQLEMVDEETGNLPCNRGLATLAPLCLDDSDEDLCMETIKRVAAQVVRDGKRLVVLGGEHSISAPLAMAHAGIADLTVLQLDAHADLRHSYEGTIRSHASVMRRICEKLPCVQVGIRSISPEGMEVLPHLSSTVFWAHEMEKGDRRWMGDAVAKLSEHVYLTLDVDVLDPSVEPATGTPEPGGLDWYSVIRFLRMVSEKHKIVGADVVEHSPVRGMIAPDFTIAKLVYKIIGMLA